jgi:uncharacterized protein YycO
MLNFLQRLLIRSLTPISKLIGKIYIAPKARKISFEHYEDMKEILVPGDTILSYSKGELTNYFIEGEYKHCAVYVGLNSVVEAIGTGVKKISLSSFLSTKDKIAVIRPRFLDSFSANTAALEALNLLGKPYDYHFEQTEKAFYCAELIAYCYNKASNNKSPFVPRNILGVKTFLPNDFKLAQNKFLTIQEFPK